MISRIGLFTLLAYTLTLNSCANRDELGNRYSTATFSRDHKITEQTGPFLEFRDVASDGKAIMVYTTNTRHTITGYPGDHLHFPNGDEVSVFRVRATSYPDQTVDLDYMTHTAGKLQ